MRDNPLDRLPDFDRVSIAAVLVCGDEDPTAALAEAGIFDLVAIPVVIGDDAGLAGGILGDGLTPNLTGVLETVYEDIADPSFSMQPDQTASRSGAAQPGTTMLPAAFGRPAFAPIRRQDDTAQSMGRDAGRYGHRSSDAPPIPSMVPRSAAPDRSGQSTLALLSIKDHPTNQAAPIGPAAVGNTNADRQDKA